MKCRYDGCYTMTPNYSNNNNFNYVDSTVHVSTLSFLAFTSDKVSNSNTK